MTVLFSTIVVIWFLNYYFKFFNFCLLFLTNSKILSVMHLLYCHQALGCHWDFFPRKNKNKKQPHHNTTGFKKDISACSVMSDSAIPWAVAHQAALSIEFSRPRILKWVTISSSRGSSQPRDWTRVSCTGGQILYHCAMIWKPIFVWGSRICVLTKLGEDGVTFCTTAFLYFTLRFCIAGTGENGGWFCSHIVTARQSYLGTHGQVISPLSSDVWTEYDERHENRSEIKM